MMNPNNQLPSVPPPMNPVPQQDDPYSFILNNPAKKKFSLLPSGNSPQQRMIMIVFVVVVLLVVGTIVAVIFASGSGGGSTESLVKATQQQQEIARISDEANKKARGSDAKNLASVTGMTMYSDQFTLKTYLQTKGKKLGAKDLGLGKNAKNDALLTQAEQTNSFDEVYLKMVVRDLVAYRNTLQAARSGTNAKTRAMIEVLIKHANTLLQTKQK